jgi:hypothetical protein
MGFARVGSNPTDIIIFLHFFSTRPGVSSVQVALWLRCAGVSADMGRFLCPCARPALEPRGAWHLTALAIEHQ